MGQFHLNRQKPTRKNGRALENNHFKCLRSTVRVFAVSLTTKLLQRDTSSTGRIRTVGTCWQLHSSCVSTRTRGSSTYCLPQHNNSSCGRIWNMAILPSIAASRGLLRNGRRSLTAEAYVKAATSDRHLNHRWYRTEGWHGVLKSEGFFGPHLQERLRLPTAGDARMATEMVATTLGNVRSKLSGKRIRASEGILFGRRTEAATQTCQFQVCRLAERKPGKKQLISIMSDLSQGILTERGGRVRQFISGRRKQAYGGHGRQLRWLC